MDQSTQVFNLSPSGHLFVQQIPEDMHTCLPFVIQVTDEATYAHSGVCILQVISCFTDHLSRVLQFLMQAPGAY